MDAPRTTPAPQGQGEREHLEQAHHEICTALTVFCSTVELVRFRLRGTPADGAPMQAHLNELEGAVARMRDIAHEMKAWHARLPPRQPDPPPPEAASPAEPSLPPA